MRNWAQNKLSMLLVAAVALAIGATAHGQATAPTTATTQRPRYVMTIPPGFHKVEVGYRVALCEPADDAWVKKVLNDAPPTTMPTTMPADVIDRLNERRGILKARM